MTGKPRSVSRTVDSSHPLPVQVELTRPIPVRLEKPPPEPFRPQDLLRNRIAWVLAIFSVILLFVWARSLPHRSKVTCGNGPVLTVHVQYPAHLFFDQTSTLDLSLHNSTAAPLTGTVMVRFEDLPVRIEGGHTTALEVRNLLPGASAGFQVSFQPHVRSFRCGEGTLSLFWAAEGGTAPCNPSDGGALTVKIWPLPFGPVRWLRVAPLSLLAQALWEWLKRRMMG